MKALTDYGFGLGDPYSMDLLRAYPKKSVPWHAMLEEARVGTSQCLCYSQDLLNAGNKISVNSHQNNEYLFDYLKLM